MSKIISFVFIAIVLAAGINTLGQIRFLDDYVAPGHEVEMHANILDRGESDVDDAQLTVYIPELGFYQSFGRFDVDRTIPVGRTMHFDIDADAEPDEYLVRVRTFTEGHWESRYRHIIVG